MFILYVLLRKPAGSSDANGLLWLHPYRIRIRCVVVINTVLQVCASLGLLLGNRTIFVGNEDRLEVQDLVA